MVKIRGIAFLLCTLPFTTVLSIPVADESLLLDAEQAVLLDADVADYPDLAFADDSVEQTSQVRRSRKCKAIPGDAEWPSLASWALLDASVRGRLVKPDPIAKICYPGAQQNLTQCNIVSGSWSNSDLHIAHPNSIMSPLYQGLTCLPGDNATSTCTQGGYPLYVLNAKNVRDVQLGVNFARNKNIRLVVKNTGHDFSGKSSGSYSLSIRTHGITGIKYIAKWGKNGYNGPAFRVGSGVIGRDLYTEVTKHNLVVVGGEGETVGWGGGYIQGGGHSPLSSIYGMAADHVLSFEVVTPDGRLITASPTQNSDVYWALRGGGGSTFGVLISTTVKAFPDLPVSVSRFSFTSSTRDVPFVNDDFWAVVRSYIEQFAVHADAGIYTYFNIFPTGTGSNVFTMTPFFAPKKTIAEVNTLLKPLLDKAAEVGIEIAPNTTTHTGFFDAWRTGFPKEAVGLYNSQPSSRLFPRENWLDTTRFNATFNALRTQVSRTDASGLIAFNIAPTLAAGGNPDNAVNSHWRETVMHAISGAVWDPSLRDLSAIRAKQEELSNVTMQAWRDVSPGAGAYLNEADINEPNFQESFWGTKYPRLYQIKQKVDPWGVFYATTAVGSEDWSAGASRLERLCPL